MSDEKHDDFENNGDDDEPHCCEDWDELSSHYHCARCHDRCSMMGHLNQDGTFSCG